MTRVSEKIFRLRIIFSCLLFENPVMFTFNFYLKKEMIIFIVMRCRFLFKLVFKVEDMNLCDIKR